MSRMLCACSMPRWMSLDLWNRRTGGPRIWRRIVSWKREIGFNGYGRNVDRRF